MTDEDETRGAPGEASGTDVGEVPREEGGPESGRLLDPEAAARLEADDRKRPIPGGEPRCPACGNQMVRRVERHPAPHGGESPFRVRLTCADEACAAWTVYDW